MDECIKCSLPDWYHNFEHVTIKSYFIALPQEFIAYLLSDGILLPEGCELPTYSNSGDHTEGQWSDDEENDPIKKVSFPELIQEMSKIIKLLNGAVFPKINTHSPKDAAWINYNNTLKCTLPAEVILLLKSSDIIGNSLSYDHGMGAMQLCLRQWIDIQPSGEFRCFIKDNHLIGVSQRQISMCYKHLLNSVEDIMTDISWFCDEFIFNKFPLQKFVMDIYRPHKGSVILIDFNVFNSITDPLLFTWRELETAVLPELRLVDPSSVIIQPLVTKLPQDAVDLSSGKDIHKLVDLLKMQGTQKEEASKQQ